MSADLMVPLVASAFIVLAISILPVSVYVTHLSDNPRIAPRVWEYGDGTRRYQPQLSDRQALWKWVSTPRRTPRYRRDWRKSTCDVGTVRHVPVLYRTELGARRKASRPQRKLDRTNLKEVKE